MPKGASQTSRRSRSSTRRLFKVNDRYVDPSRIDPKKMLYAALDSVQFNIPEVLVEPDIAHNRVSVAVNDKRQTFDTTKVDSPWRLQLKLQSIFRFVEANMNAGADLAKIEYAAVERHAVDARSALDPDGPRASARHGRVDERQVRRSRHRDPDDRSQAHGREADEGHAGVAQGHQGRRSHRQDQQRSDREPHVERSGRSHARRPSHAGDAVHRTQGRGAAAQDSISSAT